MLDCSEDLRTLDYSRPLAAPNADAPGFFAGLLWSNSADFLGVVTSILSE